MAISETKLTWSLEKGSLPAGLEIDSDGDISETEDSDSDTGSDQNEPKLKRVTVVMETIEVVKSRTYFTCC
jgi:hypothetical protein